MRRAGGIGVAVALLAGGCKGAKFSEPPGRWIEESLAGCTWAQQDTFGGEEAWVYDDQGRLVEHTDAGEGLVETWVWANRCVVEHRRESFDGAPILSELGHNIVYAECDDFGNPDKHEYATWFPGAELPTLVRRYTFDNTYDNDDRLVVAEASLEEGPWGGEPGPFQTMSYTWLDDNQPLTVELAIPGDGTLITQTYLWDHHLLLGISEEGTGREREWIRTFDRRRLTEEAYYVEEELEENIVWEFADEAEFPSGFDSFLAGSLSADRYRVEVECR